MSAIRVGLCVVVAFSVLAHGAVEAWSQAVLEIGAALLWLVWGGVSLRRRQVELHAHPLYWPMLAFGALVAVQWAFRLSVYPYLTQLELLKLAAYFILFFLAVETFRTAEEVRPFVWFLLVFGFAVALLGILQYFSARDTLYWFRPLRAGGSPFGPYVNRNHFAGLMELLLPVGLALLWLRAVARDKLALVRLFTLVPLGALFLSASRAGIASFLLQLGLLGALVWTLEAGRKRLAAATGILLVAGAWVVWLGVDVALERFAHLWANELSHSQRWVMVKDSWQIFLDAPWLGTGLGTLVTVYPQYASQHFGAVVDHVHNDYLEMLAETGLMGALCSLAFVVLLVRRALAQLQQDTTPFARAVRLGSVVACAGLLWHSLVDFNFHIPSNALLFFLLAALATRPPTRPGRLALAQVARERVALATR